ncbi:hypothetical protein N4A85_24530, partial [Escherichia coli]|uniref:hypothetical protein n=1 Tax=Escherichia coli TaxID=562 RepID=UPI0021B53640
LTTDEFKRFLKLTKRATGQPDHLPQTARLAIDTVSTLKPPGKSMSILLNEIIEKSTNETYYAVLDAAKQNLPFENDMLVFKKIVESNHLK